MTILCSENFDSMTTNTAAEMRARGWDCDDADTNGRFEVVGVPGFDGTGQSFRNAMDANSQNGAFPRLPFTGGQTLNTGDEVYMRLYMKFEAKDGGAYVFYDDSPFGHNNEQKLFYLMSETSSIWWRNELCCRCATDGDTTTGQLMVECNIHDNRILQNTGPAFVLQSHKWYGIEFYCLLGTPSSGSFTNNGGGAIKIWVKDMSGTYNSGAETLIFDYSNINFRQTGGSNNDATQPANKVWVSNNYGGADNPTHPDMWDYYDEIVASTTKVGFSGGSGFGLEDGGTDRWFTTITR